jgi:FtsP/CotA-like multicopper oxidase with cupredoxin domain
MDPIPVFKGLFGSLIVRDPTVPRPDREFFLCFHSFTPPYISLNTQFMCINGRAYAGNTPTLRAKTGESVTWHVYALDNNFHTFHLHGHRWLDTDGGYLIDTKTLGPADIITLNYTEDNPGRWFYHCHVFSHLHMGMNGWYIVSE